MNSISIKQATSIGVFFVAILTLAAIRPPCLRANDDRAVDMPCVTPELGDNRSPFCTNRCKVGRDGARSSQPSVSGEIDLI